MDINSWVKLAVKSLVISALVPLVFVLGPSYLLGTNRPLSEILIFSLLMTIGIFSIFFIFRIVPNYLKCKQLFAADNSDRVQRKISETGLLRLVMKNWFLSTDIDQFTKQE